MAQWWKKMVVYQVYWRSFQDSDGDGIGDLRGVIERLDYIKELGVDMIWFNPFYASPDVDNGYDISDYRGLLSKAGNWDDFRALMSACKARGLKVMLDLVLNHTSDQHSWFRDALDPSHPHHDFYIWRRGADGEPPTNWRSWCEPSCWTYRPEVDAYYFHSFTRQQPDLNWANPTLRRELYDIVRFWASQGVAGFRLDVINLIGKPEEFRSVPDPERYSYLANQDPVHDYLRELVAEVFDDPELCAVGETPFVTPREALLYTHPARNALDMIIHFEHMDRLPTWSLSEYRALQARWSEAVQKGAWVSQYLNNHDQPRSVSRFGDTDEHRVASAKLFATLTHLTPGTPFIYQGEEIGMTNCAFDGLDEYRDVFLLNAYRDARAQGEASREILARLDPMCRDHARTPMQWSDQPQAGFTEGTPWIKVNPNYPEVNVNRDLASPDSIYKYYQRLIRLRKDHDVLVEGIYLDHDYPSDHLYVFERAPASDDDRIAQRFLIIANTSAEDVQCLPHLIPEAEMFLHERHLILHNYSSRPVYFQESALHDSLKLRPYEVLVFMMM